MPQQIYSHTFPNGLVLLAEEMPWLDSAAIACLVPAGAIFDPPHRLGLSNFVCDMVQRGSGERTSREFVEALERLGVDHSGSASLGHSSFGGVGLAENLEPAIALFADLLQRPRLPADQLEATRQVCIQELRATEDDLAHRALEKVRGLIYPSPWGRSVQGEMAPIEMITLDDVQQFVNQCYRPNGAIISVAGNVQWDSLRDTVGRHFENWQPQPEGSIATESPTERVVHIPFDSNQTHIAIAYPGVEYSNENYYQARAAVGILSDGMSSRLFTEVREKRGLCYTVYASTHTLKDFGSVLCYSGTSTERAQETLDVMLEQLVLLSKGVEEDELQRLKGRIKSALIMQQESSATRSISMAIDWYHLGRVRPIQEVSAELDALTAGSISQYLGENPPGDFRIASLGAEPLEVKLDLS